MKSFTYVIKDPLGIHARPAALLTREAQKFPSCDMTIQCGPKKGRLKSSIAIMTLAVKTGNEVTITCTGPGEEEAAKALEDFFKENL